MARVKISEYCAKRLIFANLGINYTGISVDFNKSNWKAILDELSEDSLYVAKVDQAVKKRNKLGLVAVKRTKKQLHDDLATYRDAGYRFALVEPFVEHAKESEHYISLQRTQDGLLLHYSAQGGVDIEDHKDSLKTSLLQEEGFSESQNTTKAPQDLTAKLYDVFQESHMTYLEINPCVIEGNAYTPLDAAAEVDSSAQFFVNGRWTETDVRIPKTAINPAEKAVEELAAKSPASLSLKVLNPNGSLFLLLSGGGASVVVADEIASLGHHEDIANYGEYSGNPNEQETYLYTKQVLSLLLDSKASKKVLLIAGGVANFTDVAKTFKGIIRAINDVSRDMVAQQVSVIVRRGGPNQLNGLTNLKQFLDKSSIVNSVHGPEESLASVVKESVQRIQE